MASLMEELLEVLEKENTEYELLLQLSMDKTPVIVAADIDKLKEITDREQEVVDRVNMHEKKREEVLKDIANVLNKDLEELKINSIIKMLERQPDEQARLAQIHDNLKTTLNSFHTINEQNKRLLEQSLEMLEFDINLYKSIRQAPETANYDKGAENTGELLISPAVFDAKQ